MFITKHDDGFLHIVNQYDHSIQAGEVAAHWGNQLFNKPDSFESLCLAVKKHDIGWVESDETLLFDTETGQPIPFLSVNLLQHVDFYGKGYEQVRDEDTYAGLLVGMHWIGLYTSRFGYDPSFTFKIPEELTTFIDETVVKQQQDWVDLKMNLWNKQGPRSRFESNLWNNYEIVQFMDRLSQFVTMNLQDSTNEVTLGPVRSAAGEDCMITVSGQGDGTVIVHPFPFDAEFETTVLVRKIPDKRYESREEVLQVLEQTKMERVTWKFLRKEEGNAGATGILDSEYSIK